jgi:fructokinase
VRIGVDLGGTKIEVVALDDVGTERARTRVATPRDDYGAIVRAIRDLVTETERALGARATVGVGTPGALSPATGLLRNSNTTCLNGKPLDRDLGAALGRSVRIANDANCFALSEATDGAGRGAAIVFGAILGTGTGGGLVVHGRELRGHHAIAGEWGHNPLPWPRDDERPGPACYCGKSGCVETFLSGPGLARDHAAHGGDSRSATEIAERARGGDAAALATLARHVERLARALASVVNVLDPDVIVLGGGVSRMPHLYDELPALLGRHVFSDVAETKVLPAVHGDASGVRGAAWLWSASEAR